MYTTREETIHLVAFTRSDDLDFLSTSFLIRMSVSADSIGSLIVDVVGGLALVG